jgi:uncharacterized CHY-type Zn-finger protein
MQIIVKSDTGDQKSWTIPKALLSHYSGYFNRLRNFKEGEENTVVLPGFEPEGFRCFVEFIYYGCYDSQDKLEDHNKIRDSARNWVIGDYLDATEFKNFAIRNLHDIYFPLGRDPKIGISANAIDYCCKNSTAKSPLYSLYLKFAIRWFHRRDLVHYSVKNCSEWRAIWDMHVSFRNALLFWLNSTVNERATFMNNVDEFMEKRKVSDELGDSVV